MLSPRPLAAVSLCVGTLGGAIAIGASAQQVYPPNGLLVFGEVSTGKDGRTYLTVDTARGTLRTLTVDLGGNLVARSVASPAHDLRVGTITVQGAGTFVLKIRRKASTAKRIRLLKSRAAVVTYYPGHRKGALRLAGLNTKGVDLILQGRRGSLISPKTCPGDGRLTVTASRSGASKRAQSSSSTAC